MDRVLFEDGSMHPPPVAQEDNVNGLFDFPLFSSVSDLSDQAQSPQQELSIRTKPGLQCFEAPH